ncbi:MAG: hypothetical protein RL404_744 [Pseudomonadota bacterium]|jgi:hypothetical protein
MLTATYSIVALKLEQSRARWTFSSIQQYILSSIDNLKSAGGIDFEGMLNSLAQFEQTCHQRKMEVFVIPALRRFTHEADALLDELESLSEASLALLGSLRDKLHHALRQGAATIEEMCASLEQCCTTLYRRLTREEELVQIAERTIPSEAWFAIAADFMSHDARMTKAMAPVHDDEEE